MRARRLLCGWCWAWTRSLDAAGVCGACQLVRGAR